MAKPKRSSRRQTQPQSRAVSRPGLSDNAISATAGLPEAIVWGVLLARWLIPTEGTASGDTLWLTSLTLAAAAGFCWWMSRVSFDRVRFEKLDVAVWFLCGAHVLSAITVMVTEGNKRAASNMLWEWLAVAVLFSLLRQTITEHSRARFLRTLLVVTTALACYGIWQPAFWYPSNLQQYESLRNELDAVDSSAELSLIERNARKRELHGEFVARGIPVSGPQQQLFVNRLRDSREPLGFFALANTFAGFMAITVVMLAGVLLKWLLPSTTDDSPTRTGIRRRGLLVTIIGVLLLAAYCLLLTKSRTAWGGSVVGIATLTGMLLVRSRSNAAVMRLLPILAIGLLAFALLTGIAIATDALDVEVVSEAFMSLRYRMEYWTATWDVILDHPLLGTGPGNFREHYLSYKLPQSSEEIADPHQFVLDVATNSGVVGLIGLALFLAVLIQMAWRLRNPARHDRTTASSDLDSAGVPATTASRGAIVFAGLAILASEWLFSGSIPWHVLSIVLLAVGLDYLLSLAQGRSASSEQPHSSQLTVPPIAIVAALVTMFVHLSAAGGIAMPAVTGLVFALSAVLSIDAAGQEAGSDASQTNPSAAPQNGSWLASAVFTGLAAVGCTVTAFGPVIQATSLIQIGDYEAANGQSAQRVLRLYKDAAEFDPLSPEPHIRLGQYYLRQWQQTRNEELFEKSIEHTRKAQSLSPNSPHIAHDIGYAWLTRASQSSPQDEAAAASAAQELQNALAMYPTQPVWTAETAQALKLAGDSKNAAALARRALELDDLNRQAGHVDRYLPDPLKAIVSRIAGSK